METLEIDIARFIKEHITVFPFTDFATCKIIAEQVRSTHTFTLADTVKGNAVKQNFEHVEVNLTQIPKLGYEFDELQKALRMSQLLPENVSFNSFMAQQYVPPKKLGIGIHCDGKRFEPLIAVLVLEQGGTFMTYSNRDGENPRARITSVGDIIIFHPSLPHAVIDVEAPRLTVTARFDQRPNEKW